MLNTPACVSGLDKVAPEIHVTRLVYFEYCIQQKFSGSESVIYITRDVSSHASVEASSKRESPLRFFIMRSLAFLVSLLPFVRAAAYDWNNVKIGGGGGFVPGIVFNPTTEGVAYARTDIGGLYRLNSDDSWTPLTDAIATNAGWFV